MAFNKKNQELQELGAKLQKIRNGVYFAMTFMDFYLQVHKDEEHDNKSNEIYFDAIRDSIGGLESVRVYLDLKVKQINDKLRDNFIKRMLKKEKKNEDNSK